MSERERGIDWDKTRFDGSRREQLRRSQAMTVRQRLEALDELLALSGRLQAMPRLSEAGGVPSTVGEAGTAYLAKPPTE